MRAFAYFRQASSVKIAYLEKALKLTQKWNIPYANLQALIPDSPEAHHRAGRFFGHARGLWKPALEEFRRAGSALENRWDFRFDRGLALLFQEGDPFDDLRKAIDLAPDRNKTIRRLPFYFEAARRTAEGLPFWAELEETYPLLPGPAVNRIEAALSLRKTSMEEPMKTLDAERRSKLRAARTAGERREVQQYFAGKAEAAWRKSLSRVEPLLHERLSAFPEESQLYRLKAEILVLQRRLDEAEVAYRHACQFSSEPEYWRQYVQFLLARGGEDVEYLERARDMSIEAKGLFPDSKVFERLLAIAQESLLKKRAAERGEDGPGRKKEGK
jgi:hypothetical protein